MPPPRVALMGFHGHGNFGDDAKAVLLGRFLHQAGIPFSVYRLCEAYAEPDGFQVARSPEELLEDADVLPWGGGGRLVPWSDLLYRVLFPGVAGAFENLVQRAIHKGMPLRSTDGLRIAIDLYPSHLLATLLSTNGQNLNDPGVQQVLRDCPPTYLMVALDGLCDETNSVYRRGARLQPALDGVRALAEWKRSTGARLPILHCRFMVMRHNEHEPPNLRQFCEEAGFDMASVRTLSIIDSPLDRHTGMIPVSDSLRAYGYEGNQRVRRQDFICQHAFSFPSLMADGRLAACDQDFNCRHAYGTLWPETSFAQVWWSSQASSIRGVIRDHADQFSFCRNCPYVDGPLSSCSIYSFPLRPVVRD